MAGKSVGKFLLAVVCIALLVYVALAGIGPVDLFGKTFEIPNVMDETGGVKQGLDLVGGSVIGYEADADKVTDEEMETVESILRARLDALGHLEATIARQGDKRVRIEIPAVSDPESAVAELGAMAELSFVDADGNVILSGKEDIVSASAQFGPTQENSSTQQHYVSIKLSDDAVGKFEEATTRVSGTDYVNAGTNFIAIMLDEEVISSPQVSGPINMADIMITGEFTAEDAKYLAGVINAGKLPFGLTNVELSSVGPTLGEEALSTSLKAGFIGLLLVMLFMLLFYKLPGLMADVALVAYVAIIALVLMACRDWVTLTLPGIAGIILTIGMAVDANIIIFERVREELKTGKTLRSAVDSGFGRAIVAIIDANVTTVIAAVVLYIFGTGTIKGFAITLFVGTVVSLFTAVFVTRFLLRQLVGMNIKNSKLYA